MFKESVFIMPSILHLNNSYQHLASIMIDMAQGGEHLIFVTRPNKPHGMLIVAPYHAPTTDTTPPQKVIAITALMPKLEQMTHLPDIKNIHVLDVNNCQQQQWQSALCAVADGDTALFLKKNHRIVAEIFTHTNFDARKAALNTTNKTELNLSVVAAQQQNQPKKPDGYIGSESAIEKTQKQQFDHWQKLNAKGLVLPFSSTTWAAIKQKEHRLMWAVNHADYAHLTVSSRSSVSFEGAQAYLKRANDVAWCGYTDWRLPTVDELLTLVVQKPTQVDNMITFPMQHIADKKYQDLTTQSPYYDKPSSVCLRADFFNDIPHNQEDGRRLLNAYYVWTSTVEPLIKRIRHRLAVVSFAHNSQQRVRFDMQYAYVRLVRSY